MDKLEDRLYQMFNTQFESQASRKIYEKCNANPASRQQYINQMLLACYEEITEIMRETSYKNPDVVMFGWKKGQLENNEKMKEEIIDLWHFVMNLSLIAGMGPDEFYEKYCKKNKINNQRIVEGY